MNGFYIERKNMQPVLNFNFKTIMVFKCTRRNFAEDLLNGNVFFNIPEKWIEMEEKTKIKGQGDSLEGTYLTTSKDDKSEFISNLKLNENIEYFEKENNLHFRRKDIKKLYCFCVYGLNDNSFVEKTEDRFGKVNYCSRIGSSYFEKFTDLKSIDECLNIPKENQPVVIFINNPHLFFERIKIALMKFGFKEEEIIISPVEYIDKSKRSIAMIPYPRELLLKDIFFKEQSEIRVIINSNNIELLRKLKNNNQKINIGKINDIADIYDYYFNDLLLMREGNNIYFNLPIPEEQDLEDMTLRELLGTYLQTQEDRLPEPMPIEIRKEILDEVKRIIKKIYNFDIILEDRKFTLIGDYKDLDEILDT